ERRVNGPGAQLAGKGGDFADGFPFGRQCAEEVGFAGRGNLFANEVAHGEYDLFVGQRVAAGELFNQSLQHCASIAGGRSKMEDRRWKDRKSTRLNSSHGSISYAVFCLKKKIQQHSG